MYTRHDSEIIRIRNQYSVNKNKSKGQTSEKLVSLLDCVGMEFTLMMELHRSLSAYAEANLNRVGTGNHFIDSIKKSTKKERVVATNVLFDRMKSSSAKEIFDYVTSDEFKQMAGVHDFHVRPRGHLSDAIQDFTTQYKNFLKLTCSDALLEVLLDPLTQEKMSDDELGKLFWQYDAVLVADVMVNVYERKNFYSVGFPYHETCLDYYMLVDFLAKESETVNHVNKMKSSLYADIILPNNALTPSKNTLIEETLNPYQLYQYDEPTIFAVEQWLRERYRHLLINRIDGKQPNLSQTAPYYFYQIPSALYMLIDPEEKDNAHYYRYKKFKEDLQNLVFSSRKSLSAIDKPVIFFGIINFYNIHHLPYFIYRNESDELCVVTVDPSARSYPDEHVIALFSEDGKLTTRKRLARLFQDIFPGSRFSDADANQMLRERDCGPNAATTLLDALSTCLSDEPLLEIVNHQLKLYAKRLTINLQPIGAHPYKKTYVYSGELEELTLANRAEWEKRLKEIKTISPLTIRSNEIAFDAPLSIQDDYYLEDQIQLDYSYVDLVEHQQQQDLRLTNISAVQSLLLAHPEKKEKIVKKLAAEYDQTLSLPDARDLINFIKAEVSDEALLTLTSAHQGDISLLMADVMIALIQHHVPQSLIQAFKTQVLPKMTALPSLNANTLVQHFLDKHKVIFGKLSIRQQETIAKTLLKKAEKKVIEKLSVFYLNVVNEFMTINCRRYLAESPVDSSLDIMSALYDNNFSHISIKQAIIYLKIHADDVLRQLMSKHITQVIYLVSSHTVDCINEIENFESKNLRDLLVFISAKNNRFIEWDINKFKKYLSLSKYSTHSLKLDEVNSALSMAVLKAVNISLGNKIIELVKKMVTEQAEKFVEQQAIEDKFTRHQSMTDLNKMVDGEGNLLSTAFDADLFDKVIEQVDRKGSITKEDYAHPLVHSFICSFLKETISDSVKSALKNQYQMLSQKILIANDSNSTVDCFAQTFHRNDPYQVAMILYRVFMLNKTLSDDATVNLFNENGERFHDWFTLHKSIPLMKAFNKAKNLNNNLLSSLNLLVDFIDKYSERLPKSLLVSMEKYQADFFKLIKMMQSLSLCRDAVQDFSTLNHLYNKHLVQLSETTLTLTKYYTKGEIIPGKMAAIVRPLLVALLNIKTLTVLNDDENSKLNVYHLDSYIYHKIAKLPLVKKHVVNPLSKLITLLECKQLPESYRQPMTKQLLIDCIAYWYTNRSYFSWSQQPFIFKLIDIVNSLQNNADLNEEDILIIKGLLSQETIYDQFSMYASHDVIDKIKAALTKTISISPIEETPLSFSAVYSLLAGTPYSKNAKGNADKKLLSEHDIQEQIRVRLRQLRVPTIKKSAEGSSFTTMELPVGITLASVRQQIMKESNENEQLVEGVALARTLQHVKPVELQQAGFFSNVFSGFFNWRDPDIEKRLLLIKYKHDSQPKFQLDKEDVRFLHQRFNERWEYLVDTLGEKAAIRRYIDPVDRKDKAYIALSEILAKYYRSIGQTMQYCYHLLMPVSSMFLPPHKLIEHTLPSSICKQMNLVRANTSIDDIPLSDLIITQSGYALNINWMTHRYQLNDKMTNPYTHQQLTFDELDSICLHPKSAGFLKLISDKCCIQLTPAAIELLVSYINEAVFSEGFKGYYDKNKDEKAFAAFTKFDIALRRLSAGEQKSLLHTTIPGEAETVQDIFALSQRNYARKDGKPSEFAGKDRCLTVQGVNLARIVIAYKGKNHGLINLDVVKRAEEKGIAPRQYKVEWSEKYVNTLSEHEKYIYNNYINKKHFHGQVRKNNYSSP